MPTSYGDTGAGGTPGASPLTTKGDLYTHDGTQDTRLPVGGDGGVLQADSSETTGLRWTRPTQVGQVLHTVDGAAFSVQLPLTSAAGGWISNDDGYMLVVG